MKTVVIVTTQFEGEHLWPECNLKDVAFLQNWHRHIFHVRVEIPVEHQDRAVEFISAKRKINDYLKERWVFGRVGRNSCEMVAQDLMNSGLYVFSSVEVLEDGENGACVEKVKNDT